MRYKSNTYSAFCVKGVFLNFSLRTIFVLFLIDKAQVTYRYSDLILFQSILTHLPFYLRNRHQIIEHRIIRPLSVPY